MTTYRLWNGDAPGALGTGSEDVPTLTDFGTPGEALKPACVVCPGGGYGGLAGHEGQPVAEWMETLGIRSFVLKYRLGPKYHHPCMLDDASRAIRYVRANALSLGVDAGTVGILGFSAGGHLASTASTHFTPGQTNTSDAVDLLSSRPSFSVLIYPVVTMEFPLTHGGSRENLLGKTPSQALVDAMSNEKMVGLDTPPAFIFHGADDTVVPIQNALQYATALAQHKVPFELHVPQHGPHGFGLGERGSAQDWRDLAHRWLKLQKIVP